MLPAVLQLHGWRRVVHLFEPSDGCGFEATVQALLEDLCGLERHLAITEILPSDPDSQHSLTVTIGQIHGDVPGSAWADAVVCRLGNEQFQFRLADHLPLAAGATAIKLEDQGLQPFTEVSYELRSIASGLPAGTIMSARTAAAAPDAPTRIEVRMSRSEAGSGSVSVPACSHSLNDTSCCYSLSLTDGEGNPFTWLSEQTDTLGGFKYDFEGLVAGSVYRIEVSAINSVGRSSTAQSEFQMRQLCELIVPEDTTGDTEEHCLAEGLEDDMSGDVDDFVCFLPDVQVRANNNCCHSAMSAACAGRFGQCVARQEPLQGWMSHSASCDRHCRRLL